LSGWVLPHNPQFQILWAVVTAIAVLVVDALMWSKYSTELLLHHQAVLHYPLTARFLHDVASAVHVGTPIRMCVLTDTNSVLHGATT